MIETDILYVKKDDWLKSTANQIISKIVKGNFGKVYASRECLHEIYYVSMEEGISIDELITRTAAWNIAAKHPMCRPPPLAAKAVHEAFKAETERIVIKC